jgi:hypothetical protein
MVNDVHHASNMAGHCCAVIPSKLALFTIATILLGAVLEENATDHMAIWCYL